MNVAHYSQERRSFVTDTVLESSFSTIVDLGETMTGLGICPAHRCLDSGHVAALDPLLDMEIVDGPPLVSLVLGVTGGIRPTVRNLAHHRAASRRAGRPAQLGRHRPRRRGVDPARRRAHARGGNIRVGSRDNDRLPDRSHARSNADLVEAARRLIEATGRHVATSEQARSRLGIRAAGARTTRTA